MICSGIIIFSSIFFYILIDNHLKDVTKRYASEWLIHNRKLRIDEEWWTFTLNNYKTYDIEGDDRENILIHGEESMKEKR